MSMRIEALPLHLPRHEMSLPLVPEIARRPGPLQRLFDELRQFVLVTIKVRDRIEVCLSLPP